MGRDLPKFGATKQPDRKASTVSEPTACDRARSCPDPSYCQGCDRLVGLVGFHVLDVARDETGLRVTVESPTTVVGCVSCGVVARSHGRRDVRLVDLPCFGRPVELVWRKRIWRCAEPKCTTKAFIEQHEDLAAPRALLTTRARWWAIGQTAPRTRQRRRYRPPTGHHLAHRVALDQAAAGGDGGRRDEVRERHHSRRRRARVAPRLDQAHRARVAAAPRSSPGWSI